VAFAMIARKLQFHNWLLAAVALAATPIFFVSSVCSKDYIWALAFVLLSLLSALHNRPVLCGILLGLATGCRITSLAMGLPLALILFEQPTGRDRLRALLQFSVAAAIVAILAFSPVWLHYGTSFFSFYENHARPDWETIARRGLIEVWGVAGLVGLGIGAVGLSLRRTRTAPTNRWVVPALLLAVVIYICAYLRLPDQAGYLLPIVPAVLLLWQQFASRRTFQAVAACLLIAPFVEVSNHGFSPGAIIASVSASAVVNVDLPWNPARLEQRIARAWRKNQTRSVTVVNLVCEDSIEQQRHRPGRRTVGVAVDAAAGDRDDVDLGGDGARGDRFIGVVGALGREAETGRRNAEVAVAAADVIELDGAFEALDLRPFAVSRHKDAELIYF